MKVNELLNQATTEDIKWFINNQIKAELKKRPDQYSLGELEHILDWLKSKQAPKRLRKMAFKTALDKSREWTERMVRKAGGVVETEEDTELVHQFKKSRNRLVKLVGENSFKREGALMGHCVSSYYGKEGVEVYSLRDLDNNPHCTIELVKDGSGQINQIKGKGNGPIHPKYINDILKSLKKLGKDIRISELENLGYKDISPELKLFILNNTEGAKWLSYKGKELFYIYSQLKNK